MKQFDLNNIKRLIEEKFNWGPSDKWTNFHFKELKKSIEETTGDNLSEETLKRIFGKRKVASKNYQPQAFTKLALQKYANNLQSKLSVDVLKKSWINRKSGIIISVVLVLIVLGLFFTRKKDQNSSFTFTCNNPIEIHPFTATFNYDISNLDDSVFINFGYYDEYYLSPENNSVNIFYRTPGVYMAKLYTRTNMLDSIKVVACSNDWEGGFFPNRMFSSYEPFRDQFFYRQDENFYAQPEQLLADEGVDVNDRIYTAYRFFSPFNKSLDSLKLETTILNNASTGSLICYDAGLELIGDSGIINFNFTHSNCSPFAGVRISDKALDGIHNDLEALSVDMSDWLDITVLNQDKTFNLYLNEQLIYEQKYENLLGNLLGIVYYFSGTGKVDDLKVYDSNQNLFYSFDFGKEIPQN